MTELEQCFFYLHSGNATTNLNNLGSTLTFSNINIKELLGDLYDKYNKVKIVLNGFSNFNATTVSNRFVLIRMTGLDWVNCLEYGTNLTTIATLGAAQVGSAGSGTNTQMASNWGCDFNKPSNSAVNLTIFLHDSISNSISASTNYGSSQFFFSIYGIN